MFREPIRNENVLQLSNLNMSNLFVDLIKVAIYFTRFEINTRGAVSKSALLCAEQI